MQAQIVIEKNVPRPARAAAKASALKSAMKNMEIGDSFLIQGSDSKESVRLANSVVYSAAKDVGIKVSVRAVGETSKRVWRVS